MYHHTCKDKTLFQTSLKPLSPRLKKDLQRVSILTLSLELQQATPGPEAYHLQKYWSQITGRFLCKRALITLSLTLGFFSHWLTYSLMSMPSIGWLMKHLFFSKDQNHVSFLETYINLVITYKSFCTIFNLYIYIYITNIVTNQHPEIFSVLTFIRII